MDYKIYYENVLHESHTSSIVFDRMVLRPAVDEPYGFIHWHENLEIAYVLEGEVSYLYELDTLTVKKGQIVVINSDHIHSCKGGVCGCKIVYLIIHQSLLEQFHINIDGILFEKKITDPKLAAIFEQMAQEYAQKGFGYKSMLMARALEVVIELSRHHVEHDANEPELKGSSRKIGLCKRAMYYVQKNYQRNVSVAEIAQTLGVSKNHLCRIFKEVTAQTLMHYTNSFKCYKARRLLAQGDCTVEEAARAVGFSNLSYFYRVYKEYTGHPPGQDMPG